MKRTLSGCPPSQAPQSLTPDLRLPLKGEKMITPHFKGGDGGESYQSSMFRSTFGRLRSAEEQELQRS